MCELGLFNISSLYDNLVFSLTFFCLFQLLEEVGIEVGTTLVAATEETINNNY